MSILLNIINESIATTTEVIPEMDIFGAGIVTIIGLIALIIVIKYLLKIKKD